MPKVTIRSHTSAPAGVRCRRQTPYYKRPFDLAIGALPRVLLAPVAAIIAALVWKPLLEHSVLISSDNYGHIEDAHMMPTPLVTQDFNRALAA
jgi:hypothetical protein